MANYKRFFTSLFCVGLALTGSFGLYQLISPATPKSFNRFGREATGGATNSPLIYDPKTGYSWAKLIDDARWHFLEGDTDSAEEELSSLLERMPPSEQRIEATKLLAIVLGMRREYADTHAYLTESIELAKAIPPKDKGNGLQIGDLYFERAKWLFRDGKHEQSLRDCEAALMERGSAMDEKDEYHQLRAMNLVKLKKWDQAKRELDQIDDSDYVVIQVMLARVYRAQGLPDLESASRERAERLDPKLAAEWEELFAAGSIAE